MSAKTKWWCWKWGGHISIGFKFCGDLFSVFLSPFWRTYFVWITCKNNFHGFHYDIPNYPCSIDERLSMWWRIQSHCYSFHAIRTLNRLNYTKLTIDIHRNYDPLIKTRYVFSLIPTSMIHLIWVKVWFSFFFVFRCTWMIDQLCKCSCFFLPVIDRTTRHSHGKL